jgi:alpha-L-rhamnosidase
MRLPAVGLLLAAMPAAAAQVLTVEDRVDPIGVGDATPEFAWRSGGTGVQRAYQVQVASAADRFDTPDLWDSGRVESTSTAFVSFAGAPLRSRQQASWRVRTWDATGPSAWSPAARFEMGLLHDADWSGARWMWGDAPEDHEAHFHFRALLPASARRVTRARAYVTASHRYDLYVDGEREGQGPAFAYPDDQLYQTLDVTAAVAEAGRGHVVGLTGRWYGAGQGRPAARGGVLLKLVVDYADGTSATLDSGPAWTFRRAEWRVPDAPVSAANFRNGEGIPVETIDAREAPLGWTEPGFDDSAWKPAVLLGPHPRAPWTGPLLSQETAIDERSLAPVSVRTIAPGRVVADFGKIYAGRPRVVFPGGRAGTTVRITTDYRTQPDGSLAGFAQSTKMDYAYVQRGGRETFEPYGYLGFRYVQVDLPADQPPPETIALLARWNRLPPTQATFRSSDPTLDAVFELALHSTRYGSQEHFVDTPTREQGQFTYDAYQISRAAMRAFGERDLTQRALREFAQSQVKFHADTGKVNAVYPNGDGRRDIPDWTQSWVMWAWEYFLETGDRELASELFPQLVKTGEYVRSTENPSTGLVDLGNDPGYRSGIVDWPNRYGYDRTTTQRTVMTVNAVLVYRAIAGLAEALGRGEVATVYRDAQRRSEMAILTRLWDPDQAAYIDGLNADGSRSRHASQQANAMLLAVDLAPGGRVASMLSAVRRAGFETSPVLSRFLVQAYGEHDQQDALYDFLLNPKGRNFASILAQGGTFTWESWEGAAAKSENSESHAYGANAALEAIQRYVLGVEIVEPQAARVRIRPLLGPLAFADGSVVTERGPVRVAWKAAGPDIQVTLPANVVADVHVAAPGRRALLFMDGRRLPTHRDGAHLVARDVPPGSHRFSVRPDQEEP